MSTYAGRLQWEIENYEKRFKGRMSQDVPPVWDQVEAHQADQMEAAIGVRNLYQYVARHVRGRRTVDVLGLGSGACGNELDGIAPLLREDGCEPTLACVDVNEKILEQAAENAWQRGIRFRPVVQDINRMAVGESQYDVIVAYASLHHFLDLEHVAGEINRALRPGGVFVTVDIPTRNGYLMWDETLEVVNAIWRILPPKYRVDHMEGIEPTLVATYPNIDFSLNTFECINSEAILPALRRHLREVAFVPVYAIARRFFDTRFGPNYDLRAPLDRAIFDFVIQLDRYYLETGILKPETFFGAYEKRTPDQ